MKISEVCIKRPVLAWVITIFVVMVGIISMRRIKIRENPKYESQVITIEKAYPGVAAELIESKITKPIEDCISSVECVNSITSHSMDGQSRVTVTIDESRRIDDALNDIRDKIASQENIFPRESNSPIYKKTRNDALPIFYLSFYSDTIGKTELYNYAKQEIVRVLESIPGVAYSEVYGAGSYEMKLKLDPQRMSFYKITPIDIRDALSKNNFNISLGKLINNNKEYYVTTNAGLQTPEEFNNIPISRKNGSIIRLIDVGHASLESKTDGQYTILNGREVLVISVVAQPTANPVSIARTAKKEIAKLQENLPKEMKLEIFSDNTKFIEKSLKEIRHTIRDAIIIVLIIVLFFMNSLKASIIPLITIPVSLIGAIAIMYACGFTINTITLMSLVLAVGLVVDDAIVILENVHKYIERGYGPYKAAIEGTKEVSFAVISMTLTLCFVYAPIALASGSMGAFFKEFAITLSGSVLLSGVVALTLSPMMCSRLLANKAGSKQIWILKIFKDMTQGIIASIERLYFIALRFFLHNRLVIILLVTFFTIIGYTIFQETVKESIPYQDKKQVYINGHSPTTSTLDYTKKYINKLDKILSTVDNVEERYLSVQNSTHVGGSFVVSDSFKGPTKDIIAKLNKKMQKVAGLTIMLNDDSSSSGDMGNSIQCAIKGNTGFKELKQYEQSFINACISKRNRNGDRKFVSVLHAVNDEITSYEVEILRDRATILGIDPYSIATVLEGLMRGRCYGKFDKDQKECDVIVSAEDEAKRTPEQIFDVHIKAYTENHAEISVPLTELISIHTDMKPSSITRVDRMRARTMTVNLNNGVSMNSAIAELKEISKNLFGDKASLEFISATKKYMEESDTTLYIILIAICFIYLVMAAQFESWSDPFIILLTFPFTILGGIVTLYITKDTINMYSNIGLLTLIGLIAKHGILIVDFANKLVDQGLKFKEAAYKSAKMRFRPILMTTAAMVLGAIPLAIATGPGCEIRRSLGKTIVGGMTIGTFFTIFFVPVMYTFFAYIKKSNKIRIEHDI